MSACRAEEARGTGRRDTALGRNTSLVLVFIFSLFPLPGLLFWTLERGSRPDAAVEMGEEGFVLGNVDGGAGELEGAGPAQRPREASLPSRMYLLYPPYPGLPHPASLCSVS